MKEVRLKIYRSISEIPKYPTAVAIGNFDGIHLGHQSILKTLSKEKGLSTVVTFEPHPREVLGDTSNFKRLTLLNEKLEFLEQLNMDQVFVISFGTLFSKTEGDVFLEKYIFNPLTPTSVHVGSDFGFGRGRSFTVEKLKKVCQQKKIKLEVHSSIEFEGTKVSSSLIRNLLSEGNIDLANKFLGRAYSIKASVVAGKSRGKELGFPTANLQIPSNKLIPKEGVYVTHAFLEGNSYLSLTNIGYRPTFNEQKTKTVEVHILNFSKDIYEKELCISFSQFLREEKKFESVTALKDQILKDIKRTKENFG